MAVAGADFTLVPGPGGVDLLRQSGAHWGIKLVETIDAVRIEMKRSLALDQGSAANWCVEDAAQLLGRPIGWLDQWLKVRVGVDA